jgi:hypothetical protein
VLQRGELGCRWGLLLLLFGWLWHWHIANRGDVPA